jgi:hypothetical protein
LDIKSKVKDKDNYDNDNNNNNNNSKFENIIIKAMDRFKDELTAMAGEIRYIRSNIGMDSLTSGVNYPSNIASAQDLDVRMMQRTLANKGRNKYKKSDSSNREVKSTDVNINNKNRVKSYKNALMTCRKQQSDKLSDNNVFFNNNYGKVDNNNIISVDMVKSAEVMKLSDDLPSLSEDTECSRVPLSGSEAVLPLIDDIRGAGELELINNNNIQDINAESIAGFAPECDTVDWTLARRQRSRGTRNVTSEKRNNNVLSNKQLLSPIPLLKKRVSRTAVISITCGSGTGYANALTHARRSVMLDEMGIEAVNVKRAITYTRGC